MKSVLVVYNQPDIFFLIHELLNIKGYSVDFAFDWQEGLKKYLNNHFDMIITGAKIPKYMEHELSRQTRSSRRQHTFLIGISRTSRELNSKYFDAIFQKPFRLKTMVNNIQHLLQSEEIKGGFAVEG